MQNINQTHDCAVKRTSLDFLVYFNVSSFVYRMNQLHSLKSLDTHSDKQTKKRSVTFQQHLSLFVVEEAFKEKKDHINQQNWIKRFVFCMYVLFISRYKNERFVFCIYVFLDGKRNERVPYHIIGPITYNDHVAMDYRIIIITFHDLLQGFIYEFSLFDTKA